MNIIWARQKHWTAPVVRSRDWMVYVEILVDLVYDVTTELNQRTGLAKLLAKYTTNKAFYFLKVCLVYKYRHLL